MFLKTYASKPAQLSTLDQKHSAETGFPSTAAEYMEERLDLHKHLVQRPASTCFSRVQGNRDNSLGVFDGDLLVIDRSLALRHDSLVTAVVEGEFRVCRLLHIKQWVLENGSGKRIVINLEDDDLSVIRGRITHIIHSCA